MLTTRRQALQLILTATGVALIAGPSFAIEKDRMGFYLTGSGVRVKRVGPFTAKVYSISHYMGELPPTKSKQAVIAMDTDKVLSWRLLRDLDAKQIHDAMREGFTKNGYTDRAKVDQFLRAFTKKLPEGTNVQITYAPKPKTTTVKVDGDGNATVSGIDFMRATWSIWFGNFDQPELSDALIAHIPENARGGVGG